VAFKDSQIISYEPGSNKPKISKLIALNENILGYDDFKFMTNSDEIGKELLS